MRFWDASALLSLVLKDEHYSKACKWLMDDREPQITSSLVVFEAENRLRALLLNHDLTAEEHQQRFTALRLLLSSKLIIEKHLRNTRSLSAECRRLVTIISPATPHGTMDVIHVATARLMKAGTFITLDRNQRSLAKNSDMAVV
ncbi:MAG: PIN domain-containing protein [Verrucomicrobiaceae bacterium]|nr:PIN domain-containing protein [Verrucomicrobiaceae bacterium]